MGQDLNVPPIPGPMVQGAGAAPMMPSGIGPGGLANGPGGKNTQAVAQPFATPDSIQQGMNPSSPGGAPQQQLPAALLQAFLRSKGIR